MGKKIYDITKEFINSAVYEGNPPTELKQVRSIAHGDNCNLSQLSCCVHNGTHMDAPCHFIEGAEDISEISLQAVTGSCVVVECDRIFDADTAERMMRRLIKEYGNVKRLLLKGKHMMMALSGAEILVKYKIRLLGVETMTVGNAQIENDIDKIHRCLLGNGVLILEDLELSEVKEDTYFLYAQPLKIKGADGAPCRAMLLNRHRFSLS